ncbi:cold-shock protein [Candidatus Woesearchaeota archaeon]|nr:cold-shock protein [Candidatus Woesearchaeota archaeon]
MNGTVKFYNRKKGFGFISGEDGNDYFVHFTALPRGLSLRDNDKVSFDPAEGDRGLKAENVQLLQKASEQGDSEQAPAEEEASTEESSSDEDSSEESSEEAAEDEEETSEDSEE